MRIKIADFTPDPDLVGFDAMQAIGLSRARLLMRGRGGEPRHPSVGTVRRWVLIGCPAGGKVIRLRARMLSCQYVTMKAWVEQFERERLEAGAVG